MTCPCGRFSIDDFYMRTSCKDDIPVCNLQCSKDLPCSHQCQQVCHLGLCAPCSLSLNVTCCCGRTTVSQSCANLDENSYSCKKLCQKKRLCRKHKCGEKCCSKKDHPCSQTCGMLLDCGLHRCQHKCHQKSCPACKDCAAGGSSDRSDGNINNSDKPSSFVLDKGTICQICRRSFDSKTGSHYKQNTWFWFCRGRLLSIGGTRYL